MENRFKEALDALSDLTKMAKNNEFDWHLDVIADRAATIREALPIADKLMQEPSEKMINAGRYRKNQTRLYLDIFTAMRDQLIKEVTGEK